MRYSLFRIRKRILHRKFIYLLVIFQIAIGIGIITFSMNRYFLEKDRFDNFIKNLTETTTMIESNLVSNSALSKESISYSDYLYLNDRFSKSLDLQFSQIGTISFLYSLSEWAGVTGLTTIEVVFIGPEEMEELFSLESNSGQYFAGDNVLNNINILKGLKEQEQDGDPLEANSYFNLNESDIKLGDNIFQVNNKKYQLSKLPLEAQQKHLAIFSSNNYGEDEHLLKVEDCIFFPLDEIELKNEIWPSEQTYFRSRLLVKEQDPTSGDLWEMLKLLEERHDGEYIYNISDQYLQTKITLDQSTYEVVRLMWIALSQLLLVSISNAGILYLIFLRQRKDMAISMMVGSTFRIQIIELIGEIFGVVMCGAILGIISYYGWKHYNDLDLAMHINTIFIIIGLSLGIGFVSSSLALGKTIKLSPTSILQNQ